MKFEIEQLINNLYNKQKKLHFRIENGAYSQKK